MKKLNYYLNQLQSVERESHFDGLENDMGFGFDTDMGVAGSAQCVRPSRPAKPYSITYTNTTGGALNGVLFGYNRYSATANYGSAGGLSVSVGASITYIELLTQTALKPISCKRFRFISTTSANVNQDLTLTYRDADGRTITDPINLSIYDDPYQFSTSKIDVDYDIKIDGTAYLTFSVAGSSTFQIVVFPEVIADFGGVLSGGDGIRTYETPVLSAAYPIRGLSGIKNQVAQIGGSRSK
jgi:hypothetical protein